MALKLVIGNKNYSSWSLRAWLFLRESNLAFEEIRLPLFVDRWKSRIKTYSPAGRVPVLIDNNITVWDTAAIVNHIQERYPEQAIGWPEELRARAYARSISAELHAGFLALREELPLNIRARNTRTLDSYSPQAQADIERILEIWSSCRQVYGSFGPWLFGSFSVADVMYAPIALRFVTYNTPLDPLTQEFVRSVQSLESIQEWIRAANAETETLPFIDQLLPKSESPLTPG